MNQTSIFDALYPKYKITKPIRLIEFFGGYGSQALALKYLGVEFEHWKLVEWAVKSIQAYKDIHFSCENFNYSNTMTKEQLINQLYNLGISSNYNEPMTKQQIERLSEQQLRTIWNNIVTTHNLVNIQQVKGKDLEIVDTDKYDYILTYSFPCQDLSLAGKGKGMSDTSTRSGMLWEVERILTECYELGSLPQILLMENVPQVHGVDNLKDFNKWQLRLEELGYKNYMQDLIATDYGIPQTRNRCFMVSILGDYSYQFPKPIPLKLKLKNMLEDNVDEKYYLSDKIQEKILSVYEGNKNSVGIDLCDSQSKSRDLCSTIKSRYNCGFEHFSPEPTGILIKNATKKGYLEATDGDGIDISSRMEHHRGTVQKEKAQTLTTQCDRGVVVDTLKKDLCNKLIQDGLVEEGDVVKHSYTQQILDGNKKCVEKNDGNMITLTTRGNCVGTTVKDEIGNLRIRKLTPKECFRLMGVKDEDYERCAKNQSDSSLYHLAGDSIVVNVLMAIFKELIEDVK